MSRRNDWRFVFTAEQLKAAAHNKKQNHLLRSSFWEDQYQIAINTAKEKGFEVREYDITGGKRADLVVDTTLQSRVTECYNKRNEHRKLAEEYSQWTGVFASQDPTLLLDLDATDILYFGLGK